MNDGRKYGVDIETERKLDSIKADLHKTLVDQIKEEFKTVKEYVSELFGKDIQRIDKALEVSDTKHLEHYSDNDKRRDEIYSIRESLDKKVHDVVDDKFTLIDTKIATISESQIKLTATGLTKEQVSEKMQERKDKDNAEADRKKNTLVAIIVAVFTIFGGMISAIFYLASKMEL